MKALRWLITCAMLASVAFSLRELMQVRKLLAGLSGAKNSPIAKIVGAELQPLAGVDGGAATEPAAAPAPRTFAPRPEHAEAADTNSAPGTIIASRGGRVSPVRRGGAVLTNSDGSRLELMPAERPKPATAQRAASAVQAVKRLQPLSLPIDDPRLGLEERKHRAEAVLTGCVLAAFGLAFWARRYRIET